MFSCNNKPSHLMAQFYVIANKLFDIPIKATINNNSEDLDFKATTMNITMQLQVLCITTI